MPIPVIIFSELPPSTHFVLYPNLCLSSVLHENKSVSVISGTHVAICNSGYIYRINNFIMIWIYISCCYVVYFWLWFYFWSSVFCFGLLSLLRWYSTLHTVIFTSVYIINSHMYGCRCKMLISSSLNSNRLKVI